MTTRTSELNSVLSTLVSETGGIDYAAIVSSDGLILADTSSEGRDEPLYSAMGSTLLTMGGRIARELLGGDLEQAFVRSDAGYLIATACGRDAVLMAVASADARLGLLFYDLKRASERAAVTLGG